jgi:hypothetical protein
MTEPARREQTPDVAREAKPFAGKQTKRAVLLAKESGRKVLPSLEHRPKQAITAFTY